MKTMEAKMTVQDIANRLVDLCRQGNYTGAQQELYSENSSSHEPAHSPALKTVTGRDEIIAKGKSFQASIDQIHGGTISDPVIAGNHFAVAAMLDATYKGMGRMVMNEVCIYEVKDGKVVREEFFY